MVLPPDAAREVASAVRRLQELKRLAGSYPDLQRVLIGLYAKAVPIIERLEAADDLDALEVCKQQGLALQAEIQVLQKQGAGEEKEVFSFAADDVLDAVKCIGSAKGHLRKALARA